MKQQTYQQKDIRPYLVKHISEAIHKIHLSIGWIEDKGLMSLLQKKAYEGVEVILILIQDQDFDNRIKQLQELNDNGIIIIQLNETYRDHLIDHKFGIIDLSIVLTGNYGWGHKSAPLEETITITEGLQSLANGFETEFQFLTTLHLNSKKNKKAANPIVNLLKKLEIIKTLLKIGDTQYIHLRLKYLEQFSSDESVTQILHLLRQKEYDEALELINTFTLYHHSLRECIDPPIDSLRREIQELEEEVAAVSNEYSETQKTLHKFSTQHTATLGDLLQKILLQNKIKAKIEAQQNADKKEEFEQAKKDHEEYTKSHELAKQQKLKTLNSQEQKELKKLYRQTSLKCHPDRVAEELQAQAEEIFVDLNEAYKANDLEKVREINEQLKKGLMPSKAEGITELKKLKTTYNNLYQKLKDWQEKLNTLKAQASYQTVSNIEDWDTYFQDTKSILEKQLARLIEFNEDHIAPEQELENNATNELLGD